MLYKDKAALIPDRVKDLLERMTLQEKVRQMDMYSAGLFVEKLNPIDRKCDRHTVVRPENELEKVMGSEGIGCIHDLYPVDSSIPNKIQKYALEKTRLGIPILFSEEALHGLASSGNTIFPQMIALAATFNRELAYAVGRGIGTEMRSKGLHLSFAPVLELARDPRWGRSEETFGEDTYLAGEMAYKIVTGMQGTSLAAESSIIAEPKHFIAHSISEGGKNCAPVSVGEREMRRDYLPVFKRAVTDAKALSIMCAYHCIDGIPCAENKYLLEEILRKELGFEGFVCSDLGAIRRLNGVHKTAETPEDAIAQSIEAGMDMQFYDYDNAFFQNSIVNLVESGRLDIAAVDRAVAGILRAKFELGLFDNPYIDDGLAKKVTHCSKHVETALQTARECICLLKNEGETLPIDFKKNKKIALIGPGVIEAQYGDYSANTSQHNNIKSLPEQLAEMVPEGVELLVEKGVDVVYDQMHPVQTNELFVPDMSENGLMGEYFNDLSMSGEPVMVRKDSVVDFNFIMQVPGEGVNSNAFAVRWTGFLVSRNGYECNLGLNTADDAKLYINGKLFADSNGEKAPKMKRIRLDASQPYEIKLEYIKLKGGGERICLGNANNYDHIQEAADIAAKCDMAVMVLCESCEVCGEGRDRTMLGLPGRQKELFMAVKETKTPIVLVLMHGRALSIVEEAQASSAILDAWYPGEMGTQAIAEVLVGKTNPSGKLPVSFPQTVGQLPVYYSRLNDTGKAYVDNDGSSLFSFGHGLSYTTFEYSNLKVDTQGMGNDFRAIVSFTVENTGKREGMETAFVFIKDHYSSTVKPRIELKSFEKFSLKPKEKRSVTIDLSADAYKTLGKDMKWVLEPGSFSVLVGSGLDSLIEAYLKV